MYNVVGLILFTIAMLLINVTAWKHLPKEGNTPSEILTIIGSVFLIGASYLLAVHFWMESMGVALNETSFYVIMYLVAMCVFILGIYTNKKEGEIFGMIGNFIGLIIALIIFLLQWRGGTIYLILDSLGLS